MVRLARCENQTNFCSTVVLESKPYPECCLFCRCLPRSYGLLMYPETDPPGCVSCGKQEYGAESVCG
jgi:hypothetical protein